MKIIDKMDSKSKNNLKVGLILLVAFFALWYIESLGNFLINAYSVIRPILIGFIIAFVINLPMNFFQEKVFGKIFDPNKYRKLILALSLILSWLVFFGAVTLILGVVIPQTINAIQTAINNIPTFADKLIKVTEQIPSLNKIIIDLRDDLENFDLNILSNNLTSYLSGEVPNLLNRAQSIISSVSSTLVVILIGFICSLYVSVNKKNLKLGANRFLYSNFSEKTADNINYFCKLAYESFSTFLNTKLISCLLLGILNFVGMTILRLPYAGMIAILVGAMDIIPYFGPMVAAIFGMLMIFIQSPLQAVEFIIFWAILQQLQEKIFYPLVVGKFAGLPAIWTFVSVILGGRLFGIVGMILFIPLATIVYTLNEDRTIIKLKEKGMDNREISEKSDRSFKEMRKEILEDKLNIK